MIDLMMKVTVVTNEQKTRDCCELGNVIITLHFDIIKYCIQVEPFLTKMFTH